MISKLTAVFFASFIIQVTGAQSLQDFLKQVSENNPEIVAYGKLLEAKRYEARTGNTPADPFISAGIMPGTPEAAGTKTVWSVTQSFSFPVKYLLQKKINKNTIELAEQEFRLGKLQIMLEAKQSYFDLLYKTRLLETLNARKEGYHKLQTAWKKMLDNGQTTILEYNRIMVELSAVNLEIARTDADIRMLGEKLAYQSGNRTAPAITIEYPVIAEPDPDALLKEKSASHPSYIIPEKECEIGLREVKLSKTGSLPEFELGYESEIVPGETYTGPFGGISIPLWSNTNRVKAASARAEQLSAKRDAEIQRLNMQVRNEYSNMKAIQRSISELRDILETGGGTKYLDSALDAGEISIITYFTYVEATFSSQDKLLELENELNKSLAVLTDHELLR